MKCLKTLEIDTEKRIYRVNGVDISNAYFFRLEFHEGYWSLNIVEHDDAFSVYGNKLSELMDEDTIEQMWRKIKK